MSVEVPRFNVELAQAVSGGPTVLYVPDDRGRPTAVLALPARELPTGCQLRSITIRYVLDGRAHDCMLYPAMTFRGLPGIDKDVWIPRLPSGLVLP